jgi:hypothetical protein
MERHRDPKHNRRTTAQIREESCTKKSKRTTVRRGTRLRSRNTRSSVGSSTCVPTNHTTRAWRSTGAHASGRNTKSRVGRRQVNGKASRGKGNTSKGKAKRRIQAQILAK